MGNNNSTDMISPPDAVYTSNLPHSISKRDERSQVSDLATAPYCWIASLLIESNHGDRYSATGFSINLRPESDSTVVLTSAHCLFIQGAYAKKVTVHFPGQPTAIKATIKDLWVSPEYQKDGNPDCDFGIIMLQRKADGGFGWATQLSDAELDGRPLSACGYSNDKPKGTLWLTGGGVEELSKDRIYYMQDSLAPASGSPIFTWYKSYWTAIGVHSYGGVLNSAVRFSASMIYEILSTVNYPMTYSIESQGTKGLFLNTHKSTGSSEDDSTLTCNSSNNATLFNIIPLHKTPIADDNMNTSIIALSPTVHTGWYVNIPAEGDKLTCTTTVGQLSLQKNGENSGFLIESVDRPGVYIQINSMGTVSCQYISEKSSPSQHECFIFHRN